MTLHEEAWVCGNDCVLRKDEVHSTANELLVLKWNTENLWTFERS